MDETNEQGVGESPIEQVPPVSTVCRERMVEIIANNTKVIQDCELVLGLVNANPDLDASFCRLFGIARQPNMKDVSR